MATYNKFDQFVQDLGNGVYNNTTHSFKVMLTNVAPVATDSVKADLTEIAGTFGYTTGGNNAATTSWSNASGTSKLILADPATWTAAGGSMAAFRYVVLYDDTPTSPADPLIAWWDYGSSQILASGETFTADFDASNGVYIIA